jgi:transglutaminase-like putative cysteine protease
MNGASTQSRDLAALSAFGSVIISGTLPWAIVALFAIAWFLSFRGKRPLAGKKTASTVALLAIAVALYGLVSASILEPVVAAVCFASCVVAHRMLAEVTQQTSWQVLLTSLLLLCGGAALVGELAFAPFVLAFVVFGTWSMARMVIEGADGTGLMGVEQRPAQVQVAGGTLALIGLGLALFLVLPRLSWNLAGRRSSPGLAGAVTGMADTVRLGGGGGIKGNPRVAFRVALSPDPKRERLDAYWVVRHFTQFDGRQWSTAQEPLPAAPFVLLSHRAPRNKADQVDQEIELTPAYGSKSLVALDTPSSFLRARALSVNGSLPATLIAIPGDQVLAALEAVSFAYRATSMAEGSDVFEPDDTSTHVPRSIDPRIAALSKELRGNAETPQAIATQLERELARRYAYTLDLPGEVADPLSDFLFTRKKGHCEDFATALALMLRIEGVPSRVTTGFVGGERVRDRYVVRAGDAHAWTEAFIDGRWRRLDATPEEGRRAAPTPWLAMVTDRYERLEEWWRQAVIDYSFADQMGFARDLFKRSTSSSGNDARATKSRFWGISLTLGIIGAAWVLFSLRRRKKRRHPAEAFLEAIESKLENASIADARRVPLEELSTSLNRLGHPLGPACAMACRRYLEARFGGVSLSAAEQERLLRALEVKGATEGAQRSLARRVGSDSVRGQKVS